MRTDDFDFDLPKDLISQFPSEVRGDDRLMLLSRKTGEVSHYMMKDFPALVDEGSLLIFNNSKVRKARLYAKRVKNGSVCAFLLLDKQDGGRVWTAMTRSSKRQKEGEEYVFPGGKTAILTHVTEATARGGGTVALSFPEPLSEEWFEENGHVPLPPYIRRGDSDLDEARYQTIYAKSIGSVACPTAGLHFTEEIFDALRRRGIDFDWITLHVGAGTFLPVYEARIEDHKMHRETFTVPALTAEKINKARSVGRPVVAVGTTSVRTLESACGADGVVRSGTGETGIFIYPPYKFRVVDQMFTNFHTPKSTLLMLVSAFATRERILNAYRIAVEKGYRFFSYGDAMFIK